MPGVGMPFGAFLAAFLVLIPLPSHWKAKNIATISMISWLFVVNIISGVNTIAWENDAIIRMVTWCDIVTRIDIGSTIALPAACFCLTMHLERVASVRIVRISCEDKRRWMLIDLALCFGVPMMYMGLYYVVQGHRFDIVEGFGCQAETYVSVPEFFLMRFPPILFSLGTLIFSTMSFFHFLKRRATFATHLNDKTGGSALTPGRYFRLMAMALVEIFWSLLVTIFDTAFSYRDGLRPWTSWSDVHSNFSRIGQFPLFLIPKGTLGMTYFIWWSVPVSTYLFFVFFAFGRDSRLEYVRAFQWCKGKIGGTCKQNEKASEKAFAPRCWKAWFLRKSNLTNNFKGQSLHSISRAPLGRYTSSEKEAPLSSASNTSFTLTTIPCLPQDEEMGFSSPPMIAEGDHACSLEPLSPSPSLDMDHRNVRPRTDDFTDIVLDISAANTQVR